jgi:hypothetical protein
LICCDSSQIFELFRPFKGTNEGTEFKITASSLSQTEGLSYKDMTLTVTVLGLQIDCRRIPFLPGEEIQLPILLSNKGYLQSKVAEFSYRNESAFTSGTATECRIVLVLNIQISTLCHLDVSITAHRGLPPHTKGFKW